MRTDDVADDSVATADDNDDLVDVVGVVNGDFEINRWSDDDNKLLDIVVVVCDAGVVTADCDDED